MVISAQSYHFPKDFDTQLEVEHLVGEIYIGCKQDMSKTPNPPIEKINKGIVQ